MRNSKRTGTKSTELSASRAARRSGKPTKREGKVDKQKAKTKEVRSQKKIATIKKTRQ